MTLLGKTGLLGWVWVDAEDLPVLQVTTQSHTEALRAPARVFLPLCSTSCRALLLVLWGLIQPLPLGAQVPGEAGPGGRGWASTLGAVQAGSGGRKKA